MTQEIINNAKRSTLKNLHIYNWNAGLNRHFWEKKFLIKVKKNQRSFV